MLSNGLLEQVPWRWLLQLSELDCCSTDCSLLDTAYMHVHMDTELNRQVLLVTHVDLQYTYTAYFPHLSIKQRGMCVGLALSSLSSSSSLWTSLKIQTMLVSICRLLFKVNIQNNKILIQMLSHYTCCSKIEYIGQAVLFLKWMIDNTAKGGNKFSMYR